MTAVLVFPGAASAHVLTTAEAAQKAKPYAQRVVDDPQVPFAFYGLTCRALFPHQKPCVVNYDTPQ
jgi:hypothetical protein